MNRFGQNDALAAHILTPERIVGPDRAAVAWQSIGLAAAGAAGWLIFGNAPGGSSGLAWVIALLCLFGALNNLRGVRAHGMQLRLTEEGVDWKTPQERGSVTWARVEMFAIKEVGGPGVVARLRNEDIPGLRGPRLTANEIAIPGKYELSDIELVKLLEQWRYWATIRPRR